MKTFEEFCEAEEPVFHMSNGKMFPTGMWKTWLAFMSHMKGAGYKAGKEIAPVTRINNDMVVTDIEQRFSRGDDIIELWLSSALGLSIRVTPVKGIQSIGDTEIETNDFCMKYFGIRPKEIRASGNRAWGAQIARTSVQAIDMTRKMKS